MIFKPVVVHDVMCSYNPKTIIFHIRLCGDIQTWIWICSLRLASSLPWIASVIDIESRASEMRDDRKAFECHKWPHYLTFMFLLSLLWGVEITTTKNTRMSSWLHQEIPFNRVEGNWKAKNYMWQEDLKEGGDLSMKKETLEVKKIYFDEFPSLDHQRLLPFGIQLAIR